jgi:hypothetical protein
MEFISVGETANAAFYRSYETFEGGHLVKRARKRIKNLVLHHGNELCHSLLTVQHFLMKNCFTIITQSTSFPELVPCYFCLPLRLKMGLKIRRSTSAEEIQQNARASLITIPEKDFRRTFQSWQNRMKKWVRAEGQCFEGD